MQSKAIHLGEMREVGVVWFDKNPHAFPAGTNFYAVEAAAVLMALLPQAELDEIIATLERDGDEWGCAARLRAAMSGGEPIHDPAQPGLFDPAAEVSNA